MLRIKDGGDDYDDEDEEDPAIGDSFREVLAAVLLFVGVLAAVPLVLLLLLLLLCTCNHIQCYNSNINNKTKL